MITHEKVAHAWGEDLIQRATPSSVHKLPIPEATKSLLCRVGVPQRAEFLITFEIGNDGIQTLEEFSGSAVEKLGKKAGHYWRIGSDGGSQLCLDDERNGAVVAVDPTGAIETRFVNSNVESLLESLLAVRKYQADRPGIKQSEFIEIVNEIRNELSAIDANALADANNWWSLILEQMEDGLL